MHSACSTHAMIAIPVSNPSCCHQICSQVKMKLLQKTPEMRWHFTCSDPMMQTTILLRKSCQPKGIQLASWTTMKATLVPLPLGTTSNAVNRCKSASSRCSLMSMTAQTTCPINSHRQRPNTVPSFLSAFSHKMMLRMMNAVNKKSSPSMNNHSRSSPSFLCRN